VNAPQMRFLDADHVHVGDVSLHDMPVYDDGAARLGHVRGLVLDPSRPHVYFIVVDSGGWFRSRRFLLPIGHARLDEDVLRADVSKQALDRYPQFDSAWFGELTSEQLRTFERDAAAPCGPNESIDDDVQSYDAIAQSRQPQWWVGRPMSSDEAELVRSAMPSGPAGR
jgi:PRC-barrel domain protein